MAERVEYIRREQELDKILGLANKWGTLRVACIEADGGIGKTRLLQEVHEHYTKPDSGEEDRPSVPVVVADIMDFDALNFHVWENVQREIAKMLGGEPVFETYLTAALDLRRMEVSGVSAVGVARQKEEANRAFLTCFNKVSAERRVVLFWDTTELMPPDIQDSLTQMLPRLKNCLSLLAGRNAGAIGERLQSTIKDSIRLIHLTPLDPEASNEYLRRKLELMAVSLDADQSQKLVQLAQGRPILIDLAVEWFNRDIPFDWLDGTDLQELKALSDDQLSTKCSDFEKQLVGSIGQTRTDMDWLLFAMSHVYPLDTTMIAPLLKKSDAEATKLFNEARTYAFVKSLPDQRIKLHDEMQRMVQKHVAPNVDPYWTRRRSYSMIAAEYLGRKIKETEASINQLASGGGPEMLESVPDALRERYRLERELLLLEEQCLNHMLVVDVAEGIDLFTEAFDKMTDSYNYRSRGLLLDEVLKYETKLTPQQRCDVLRRQAEHLNYEAKYDEAEQITSDLLAETTPSLEERFALLNLRANARIRLGAYGAAIEDFQAFVEIANELGDLAKQAQASNALGWAYRKSGQFKEAIELYQEALDLSVRAGDKTKVKMQRGWIYNNLVYAQGHLGEGLDKSTENLFKMAAELWKEIDFARGLGALYVAYMMFKRHREEYDVALDYGELAWKIFSNQNDVEWLSRVAYEQGKAYLRKEEFKKAQESLEVAQKYGMVADQAEIEYWLVEAYIATEHYSAAREANRRGAQKAVELDYALHYLSQEAHISDLMEETDTADELIDKYRAYREQYPEALGQGPGEATFFYYLANIALRRYLNQRGDEESGVRAIDYYQLALKNAAKHLDYGPYQLSRFLNELDGRFGQSDDEKLVRFRQKLGAALYKTWQTTQWDDLMPAAEGAQEEPRLAEKAPEGRWYFLKWQRS